MSDVVDVLQHQYNRQPTDEELQQLLSMSWHMIEENCCSTGRETISDLLNLAMLPKKDNISKNDKPLNEITNPWLRQQIEHFEYIKVEDFEKYSTLANIEEFKESRKKLYLDIFEDKRTIELSK